MTIPFISVIIPTYNSQKTLRRCLDSVTSQNYGQKEIWLIDNQSIDATVSIINEYVALYPYINYISVKDEGIYDAMNKGMRVASGTWLYFLGSDDILCNENVLPAISTHLTKPSSVIVYGNVIIKNSESDGEKYIWGGEFDLNRILRYNISHQAIFYHYSVFKQVGGYDLKYKILADYDFNLKCFANYEFSYTNLDIAIFNSGGASTQVVDEIFENDKIKNIVTYFRGKLFSSYFISSRLHIQKAAFSKNTGIGFFTRLYCLLAYAKLKVYSFIK